MNRKGFTLIEVLLVIAILAIIMILLVPNIFVLVEKNEQNSCNTIVKNIESAAKIYVSENKYNLGFTCGGTKNIKLRTLVESGDLVLDSTGQIINPIDNTMLFDEEIEDYDSIIQINVTYNCSTKEFTYKVSGIDCTND